MPIELILLALVTAFRPTGVAAVYTLVSAPAPRRLMSAYVIAGLAFTVTFGLIVILAFKGIHIRSGTSRTTAIAEIVGGVLALVAGGLVLTGHIRAAPRRDEPRPSGRWASARDRHLTTRTAAVAGIATHIPGLFYLIALDLIVASQPKLLESVTLVLVYNAVWFALALIALALCIANPAAARAAIEAVQAAGRRHARTIIAAISLGAGITLLVRGLTAI